MCMRKRLLDLVLGGNPHVEFLILLVLGGFLQESYSTLAQASYDVNDRVGNFIRSLFEEYFNGENLVVSKSSAVTSVDASDKRQQQPDSTSSTSTLATTVTADGNFDL
ncbi:hypothetical protein Tco_0868622 [Tanacetum coccineum]